jgi:2-polyprenyl-3-methyl-5-hydroxy-6-metoxy-1,4-benzoquinol methylase
MQTANTKYLDSNENRNFYSTSDGAFMPEQYVTRAHLFLPRLKWVREWVHTNGYRTVLDIGCKDGYLGLTLSAEGRDYVGIDPSTDAIERAKQLNTKYNLDAKYINAFFEDYELKYDENIRKYGKYECVVCTEVIEHVVNADAFMEKICSAGIFVFLSTPDYDGQSGIEDSKRNEAHVRLFKKNELEKFCSKYGDIMESIVIEDQLCIAIKTF